MILIDEISLNVIARAEYNTEILIEVNYLIKINEDISMTNMLDKNGGISKLSLLKLDNVAMPLLNMIKLSNPINFDKKYEKYLLLKLMPIFKEKYPNLSKYEFYEEKDRLIFKIYT